METNHFQGFPVVFQVQSVTFFHINDAKMNVQKTTGFGPCFANVVWTMQFCIYCEKNIRCGPLSFLLIRCLYEQIMINKRWNWNPNECIDSVELITLWGSNGHWHAHQHLSDLSYGTYWWLRQRLDVFDWWCSEGDVIWCDPELLLWAWKFLKYVEIKSRYQEIFCMKTYKNTKSLCFLVISACFLCRYSPDGLLPLSICDARCSLRQCHAHDQLHHGDAIFLQHLGTNRTEWKNRRTP